MNKVTTISLSYELISTIKPILKKNSAKLSPLIENLLWNYIKQKNIEYGITNQ